MSGGNFFAAQALSKSIQRRELETTVARHAGNGSFTVQVTSDKRLNDRTLEVALEIQDVERKSKFFSHTTSVINIVERTTTRREGITVFVNVNATALIPQLHGKANEVVPLFF